MARLNALNIVVSGTTTKAQLAEIYGQVIDNVQKNTISNLLKNRHLSGDFNAGTLEAYRIEMSASKPYGTARAAAKAEISKPKPVVVPVDKNRELLKEWEKYDLQRFGIVDLMKREAGNMALSMERELETAFFDVAKTAGTKFTPKAGLTTWIQKTSDAILAVEKTKNEFVHGVPRNLIHVVCDPTVYEELRDFIDTQSKPNVDTTIEEFGRRHGVWYYSSIYLPTNVDFIIMVEESVAQPVKITQYDENGNIPLSNAVADGFFYDYGCVGVMPDLIKWVGSAA